VSGGLQFLPIVEHGVLPELVMFIPGKPQTAGSKSAFVNPKTGKAIVTESGKAESKARKRTWRGDLRDAAEPARERQWDRETPTEDALEVIFTFVRARPSPHLTTGKNAGVVKDWARGLRPSTRPDALKMARAAEDALTGVLWVDDAQIVDERLHKVFGDQIGLGPRAEGLLMAVRGARTYGGPLIVPGDLT
jgi:Holliday junction resolvase RusA-like endonuclease